MNFYCPDCKKAFYDWTAYESHLTEKYICVRCHEKFADFTLLAEHKNATEMKCEDKCTPFIHKMQYEIRETNDTIEVYKKDYVKKSLTHKYKLIVDEHTLETHDIHPFDRFKTVDEGYSSDAWRSMITGNNEEMLLKAEFGSSVVDKLNSTITMMSEGITQRQIQIQCVVPKTSDGFISQKFRCTPTFNHIDAIYDNNDSKEDHSSGKKDFPESVLGEPLDETPRHKKKWFEIF